MHKLTLEKDGKPHVQIRLFFRSTQPNLRVKTKSTLNKITQVVTYST